MRGVGTAFFSSSGLSVIRESVVSTMATMETGLILERAWQRDFASRGFVPKAG